MTAEEWIRQLLSGDDPLTKQLLQNSLEMMGKGRVFGGTISKLPEKEPQKKGPDNLGNETTGPETKR